MLKKHYLFLHVLLFKIKKLTMHCCQINYNDKWKHGDTSKSKLLNNSAEFSLYLLIISLFKLFISYILASLLSCTIFIVFRIMKNENQYLILYINQILRLKCLLINIYNQKEPMTAFKIFLSLDLAHLLYHHNPFK